MLPETIQSLGGPFQDERLLKDPQSQLAAALYNRLLEDVAQLTRTGPAVWVSFLTSSGGTGAISPANVTHQTFWGSSDTTKPVVAKTSTGVYTVTFAAEFDDGLVGVPNMESVAQTQAVVFTFAGRPNVRHATGDARVLSIASNVITVNVLDSSNTLSDLGGSVRVEFPLR